MNKYIRLKEYKVLLYRLFLVFFFYFIARFLFFVLNNEFLNVGSTAEFFRIAYYGLTFDTSAIIYINSLFILLSLLPLCINTNKKYQKIVFYVYFIPNLIAYATNYIDIIYYRFIYNRTTMAVLGSLENESNKIKLLYRNLYDYWYVFLLFIVLSIIWVYLYKLVKVGKVTSINKTKYFIGSTVFFLLFATVSIGGIRGGFKHSTRPINMLDASRYVKKQEHTDLVLNTPFSIIRTIGQNKFKKVNFVTESIIKEKINPIKQYNSEKTLEKPNLVIFIIESYGREYIGAFNKNKGIKNYKSYTPFIDSLANHSLVFENSFANGRKSIHGMSSVLSGIPSFKTAFTSSPYVNQPIESIVSICNEMGYDTSFFHGAPNGSMGFLGYSNILGFNNYYGQKEYESKNKNADDFDGIWGIWDEPFLEYMEETISEKNSPFMATVFTVTSHTPFIIPDKYEGKFPEGDIQMHKCVGYTDFSIKKFFDEAKNKPWFKNTVFAFTADHVNQVHYKEYLKPINRFAVPIMFYYPGDDIELLKGERTDIAQQIDIYPTLVDIIGYKKPFRSWGRSLLNDSISVPYAINGTGKLYQILQGNYICIFDGQNAIGFYDINDKQLNTNLIDHRNKEMDEIEEKCKAFVQDYMNRIIDGGLTSKVKK